MRNKMLLPLKVSSVAFLLFLCLISCKKTTEKPTDYSDQVAQVERRLSGTYYNKDYCLLVDFSRHSGKKRMFLYNLKTKHIEKSILVAHGDGCGQQDGTPASFSNLVGSNCSSLGFSVLGNRAYSNWGIHIKYWLEGLEPTNNNMRKRVVVMHSWSGIPYEETYPTPITQSQGCFTISNDSLRFLDSFITGLDNQQIMLYAFQ